MIAAACAWLAGVKPDGTAALPNSGKAAADERADNLVKIFREQRCARAIGREYLGCFPAEANKHHLLSLIGQHADESRSFAASSLGEWISSRIRDDFSSTRVVNVRGWVLSETEARICALAALS
jgi:hypothetical protein